MIHRVVTPLSLGWKYLAQSLPSAPPLTLVALLSVIRFALPSQPAAFDSKPPLDVEKPGVSDAIPEAIPRRSCHDRSPRRQVCALVNGGGYAEYCTAPQACRCPPPPIPRARSSRRQGGDPAAVRPCAARCAPPVARPAPEPPDPAPPRGATWRGVRLQRPPALVAGPQRVLGRVG